MTQYQVDSDAVLGTSNAMRSSAGRLQAEVAAMGNHVVELQSVWTGSAAAAFQGVAADWRATQLRVEESLSALIHALDRAGQQYAEAEQANASLFAR